MTQEERMAEYARKRHEAVRAVEVLAAGRGSVPLADVTSLMPVNPEWAEYAPKHLRRAK